MSLFSNRREREFIIVAAMIKMYCRANHGSLYGLCPACSELSEYAHNRLLKCVYEDQKPVCKQCPVHCYSPQRREQMRQVMRWAGPQMIYRKPVFAFIHMIDNFTSRKIISKNPDKNVASK